MMKYFLLVFILLEYSLSLAQINTGQAKNAGMSNSVVSTSRGIEAIHTNPANLAFFDRKTWEISFIPQPNIDFQNSVFSYGTYKKYLTGNADKSAKYLTDQDKNDIISLFPDNESEEIMTSAVINILSLTANYKGIYGGFGFSIRERMFNYTGLPKDALKLVLFGNSLNQNFNFNKLSGSGYWFREYSLGYGFQFLKTAESKAAFGINLKFLSGTAIYNLSNSAANFTTTDTSINGRIKFKALYSYDNFFDGNEGYKLFGNAGQGQAFDLGFSYIANDIVSLGVCLQDLGYIIWKKNVYEVNIDTSGIIKNVFDDNEYEPFKNIIDDHKQELSKKQISLPYSINAGIAINLDKTEYFQDINSFPITLSFEYNSTAAVDYFLPKRLTFYSFGFSAYPLKWLPLRAGYIFGDMPSRFSVGTGFNSSNFDIDFAFSNIGTLFLAESSKAFSFSFSTKILF